MAQETSKCPTAVASSEELANSITHGVGLLLAIIGLVPLTLWSIDTGHTTRIVACTIFGVSLIVLYGASTLYHAVSDPQLKEAFQLADHICIYLLIAGSYTPFTLVSLGGNWGWSLLAAIWLLALLGTTFKLIFGFQMIYVSTALYLVMGWLAIIAAGPIIQSLPVGALALLVAGGLSYTFGVIFYLRDHIPFSHTVWHGFVLSGSFFHYLAVLLYVVPLPVA